MYSKQRDIFQVRTTIWYQRAATDFVLSFSNFSFISSYMLLLSSLKFSTFPSVMYEKGSSLVENLIFSRNGAHVTHMAC